MHGSDSPVAHYLRSQVKTQPHCCNDYSALYTKSPNLTYLPVCLSMRKAASTLSSRDRIGQLTMRNLDFTDTRDKPRVYSQVGLLTPGEASALPRNQTMAVIDNRNIVKPGNISMLINRFKRCEVEWFEMTRYLSFENLSGTRQPYVELAYALAPTIEDAMHAGAWCNRSALSSLAITSRPDFERVGQWL